MCTMSNYDYYNCSINFALKETIRVFKVSSFRLVLYLVINLPPHSFLWNELVGDSKKGVHSNHHKFTHQI